LPSLASPELSTEDWFAVFDQLAHIGCRRVTFLGGEPLLRDDLEDLIAYVRNTGMSCILTSNGVLVSRHIDRLRFLSTLVLSLDGMESSNDAVRGEGVFEAVKESIAVARRTGIPTKINFVLSKRSSSCLDEFLDFIEKQDLYLTINVVRSEAKELWKDASSIKENDSRIREDLEKIALYTSKNGRILFSERTYRYAALWNNYSRDRLEKGELSPSDPLVRKGPRCQAGKYYMTINPDGTVYPCVLTIGKIPGGNVLQGGVVEAWQKLQDHGCIACFSPCLVENNYLFSVNLRVILSFLKKYYFRFE
jgi:MoaA/NifB/PqqE/SkfB family radical SAM enzyme